MAQRDQLVQRIILDAADLARDLAFGEITLKIQHGRVIRAELHESYLPAEETASIARDTADLVHATLNSRTG